MIARPRTNWAGNVAFAAPGFYRPSSLSELQAVVARSDRIRVLATGHSFNDIADSAGAQVTLAGLPAEVSVDSARSVARVAAGLSYAEVCVRLDAHGFALRNLASLPHISVAGAIATATHGSGAANQNLAAAVAGLTLVTASGDVVELTREDGAGVHLGALDVVSSLLLELVPAFDISQWVYEDLPLDTLDNRLTDVMASAYSVSLFTDWRAPRLTQLWFKQAPGPSPSLTREPWFAAAPRPHWGKVFTTPPDDLRARYERLPDFLALMRRLDPTAKFRNPYTARYLGA
jgi:xylitol oxidase